MSDNGRALEMWYSTFQEKFPNFSVICEKGLGRSLVPAPPRPMWLSLDYCVSQECPYLRGEEKAPSSQSCSQGLGRC